MEFRFHPRDAASAEWAAYGVRDAIVFAVGFILALVLVAPSG